MVAWASPRLTSFGSTLSKLAKNSSVPSAILSLIIGTGTRMTSSPPGGKVKVRKIPVKSPAIEEEVLIVGGRKVRWNGWHEKEVEVKWEREKEKEVK